MDSLAPIFDAENLGRVRHLGLANTDLADRIAAQLVDSKILPRLATLDLSRGTLGDDGARAILESRAAFAHLEAIDLSRSFISPAVAAELSKIGPRVVLADLQEEDTDGDETYRYVQISE
jgi:hypothetical protein